MSHKVELKVSAGPMKDKVFTFAEHDTFIFGRMDDCHCCLPDDIQVSRHHFFLEMNPPDARIRDFGSMNGTWVNGKKIGAREQGETPEEGLKRGYHSTILPVSSCWSNLELLEEGKTCRSFRCSTVL